MSARRRRARRRQGGAGGRSAERFEGVYRPDGERISLPASWGGHTLGPLERRALLEGESIMVTVRGGRLAGIRIDPSRGHRIAFGGTGGRRAAAPEPKRETAGAERPERPARPAAPTVAPDLPASWAGHRFDEGERRILDEGVAVTVVTRDGRSIEVQAVEHPDGRRLEIRRQPRGLLRMPRFPGGRA